MKQPNNQEILRKNPHLDPKQIAEHEAFEARMVDAGLEVRTKYLVEPALGSTMTPTTRR